jgi:hypothetical protein
MKRTLLLLLSFLQFGILGYAQITFEKTIGGFYDDRGQSVAQTNDGGYIITGRIGGSTLGSSHIWLIKTNEYGDTLWTKTLGGNTSKVGNSVIQSSDGGYVVVGSKYNGSYQDVYLIKTNSSGNTIWTRSFGGAYEDIGFSVEQTNDGGYIITGSKGINSSINCDVYLIKTDTGGNMIWDKTYGGPLIEQGDCVTQTSDSGYIIAGLTQSFGAGYNDVYLIRTNKTGDTLWTKTYGGADYDEGHALVKTNDGGFLITGLATAGDGFGDVFIIKTTANGDTIWTKTYGGPNTEYGASVSKVLDGGYIITGTKYKVGWGYGDVYLIRIDANGDSLWSKTFGGTDDDYGSCIKQTNDGGFIITGTKYNYAITNNDVYLIKTNANGQVMGVEDNIAQSNTFTLSPNPFSHFTQISFGQTYGDIALEVYNIQGQRVTENHYAACNEITLHRNGLRQGMYFLQLTLDGKRVETRKIIISE